MSFSEYTQVLNRAASQAIRRLRQAHSVEYQEYLEYEMLQHGYIPNPRKAGKPRWIRKGK